MKLKNFFNAVKEGNLDLVKKGVRSGIDPHTSKDEKNKTALEIASDAGHDDIVAYLLSIENDTSLSKQVDHMEENPICVIGFASIFPGSGTTPEDFWQTLCKENPAITDVPNERWTAEEYYDVDRKVPGKMYTKRGGFIDHSAYGFDATFFNIVPKEAQIMDPQQRVMLEGIWYAMEHAGINPAELKGKPVGVFCGIMTHDYADMLIQSGIEHNSFIGTGNGASVLSGRVSYVFGFQGPSITIDTACSSSLVTTHQACTSLRLKECDVAFSAGINLMLAPGVTINCCKANMLSVDGSCKTFSDQADGYGRGEGCGVVVLKRYKDAIRDNNKIYGFIKGSAVNQDGATSGLTVPNKQAQMDVIQRALRQARLSENDIDYIEAHGTGTPTGDPIEINSLKEVFSNRNKNTAPISVNSVKTYVGHLEAAAGVAGLIKVLLSLENETLPALPLVGSLNPKINLENSAIAIQRKTQKWEKKEAHVRRAGISSFGFSGTNAHVIVEENSYPLSEKQRLDLQWQEEERLEVPIHPSRDFSLQLLTISAKSEEALKRVIKSYIDLINKVIDKGSDRWIDLVYSTNLNRQHFSYKKAIQASSLDECLKELTKLSFKQVEEKYFSLSPVTGVTIPSLEDLNLSSFQERYEADSLFYSLFQAHKDDLAAEDFTSITKILMKVDDDSLTPLHYNLAKFIVVYIMYERFERLGFSLQKINSEGSGHYLAAVLDGRLSLSAGLRLFKAFYLKNMDLYNKFHREVVIHKGNGLWAVDSDNLCLNLFNQVIKVTYSPFDFPIPLTSASQESLIDCLYRAYIAGFNVNWRSYWQGSIRTPLQLPQYSFQKDFYRFKQGSDLKNSSVNVSPHPQKMNSHAKSYQLTWSPFDLNNCNELKQILNRHNQEKSFLSESPRMSLDIYKIGNSFFELHEVKKDGDCGYTAFGIERKEAYDLLKKNLFEISHLLEPLVKELLLKNEFIKYLVDKDFAPESIRDTYQKYQQISLQNGNINEISNTLFLYANDLNVVGGYLDYDVKEEKVESGWCHPCVLQALAHVQEVQLYIWTKEGEEIIPHKPYDKYIVKNALTNKHLLFVNGNHFELLDDVTEEQKAREESKSVQRRIRMLFKVSQKQYSDKNLSSNLKELFEKLGVEPVWVTSGEKSTNGIHSYRIKFDHPEDWDWLANEVKGLEIARIIDLSYLDTDSLVAEAQKNKSTLSFLTNQLMASHLCFSSLMKKEIHCDYFAYFPEESSLHLENIAACIAGLQGQLRSIATYLSQSAIVMMQIPLSSSNIKYALESTLGKEIKGIMLKMEEKNWSIQRLQPYPVSKQAIDQKSILNFNGSIVITGGLGALGLTLTKWFAQMGAKQFALLARSALSTQQKETVEKIKSQYNAEIIVYQVDIAADAPLLESTILEISKKSSIEAVFHLAGKAEIKRFQKITIEDYQASLSGKAIGAINLKHALTKLDAWPKHVIFFSSSASILPELGQTTYAAANSVLDALAVQSADSDCKIQTINWGLWGAAGIGSEIEFVKRIRSGSHILSEEESQEYLLEALHIPAHQRAFFNVEWAEYIKHLSLAEREMVLPCIPIEPSLIISMPKNKDSQREKLIRMTESDKRTYLISNIQNILHDVTGLEYNQLKIEKKFEEELAIDSNLLSEIQQKIQENFGDEKAPLPATLLFQKQNINEVVNFLIDYLPKNSTQEELKESPTEYIRKQVETNTVEVKIKLMYSSAEEKEPPLILIHTIMGSVFFYRPLVDFMHYHGSIYGVDDPYFSSLDKKYQTLRDMAFNYAKAIKLKFSGRNIRLAGLSFAGCVAYEVAQQLSEMGEKIDSVIMFDTAMPIAGKLNLPKDDRQYVMGEVAEDINQYYQAAINHNQFLLNTYEPIKPKMGLRVILFKARSRDSVNKSLPSLNLECNGWLEIFCPEVYSVPGSHFSLFDRGYIRSTTQAMQFVYSRQDYFIDKYLKPDVRFNQEQLLLQAAKNGDYYLVLRLLQQDIDPLCTDEEGNTSACYAAINDDLCSLSWIHYYAGSKLNLSSLHEWAIRGKSLKAMSYLVEHENSIQIPIPDFTLGLDTNKMQDKIFMREEQIYTQREWLDILASHNASSSKSSHLSGPMQILPVSKNNIASSNSKSLLNKTEIKCGLKFKYDVVCQIRRGEQHDPNLFMFHAASGLALPYSGLAGFNFGKIYGISNPYFGETEGACFESIEQMSQHYLERIKAIQKEGPYYLAGWSLGGIVAAAIAALLEGNGEKVAWVVMIDSVNHFSKPYHEKQETEAINQILRKYESIIRYEGMQEAIIKCYLNTSKLLKKYKAQPFSGKVYLLKAEEHEATHPNDNQELIKWRQEILDDPFSGWGEIFLNLEVYSIKGGHNDLFESKYVSGLQSILEMICKKTIKNEEISNLPNRWCMNLLKSLRRKDERLVNLLLKFPEKDYSYRDEQGNLLDFIQSQNDSGLLERLDKNYLAFIRTSSGSRAAEIALQYGRFDLFIEFDRINNQEASPRNLGFFQSGSQTIAASSHSSKAASKLNQNQDIQIVKNNS